MAFLGDVYLVTSPTRVGTVHTSLSTELFRRCHIRVHTGKTRVWNAAGFRPHACDWLEREAALENAGPVWGGSGVSSFEQGVKILGTPLGHPGNVRAQLEYSSIDHQRLLDRIPSVADVQAAWLILLHCAQAKANFLVRVVRPDAVRSFAQRHDDGLYQCLCGILQIDPVQCAHEARETATLPLMLGGLGLRSAERISVPSFWASWADCLQMLNERHPTVAEECVRQLEGDPTSMAL